MKKNWEDIKWIFEPDGALRDIYVQDVRQSDYRKLINLLNSQYKLKFGGEYSNQIDFDYIQKMWNDETGKIETKSLTINLEGITVKSHFFIPEQIEFDIQPRQIIQLSDFDKVLNFMENISKVVGKQVTLTNENRIEFPLIKIDSKKGIEIILRKDEMIKISKKAGIYVNWFGRIKNLLFPKKFSREEFEYEAMKSAFEKFEATPKERNVW